MTSVTLLKHFVNREDLDRDAESYRSLSVEVVGLANVHPLRSCGSIDDE